MTQVEMIEPKPRVFKARSGWLAVSQPGSTLLIGVTGSSEEDALQRFRDEIAAWKRLREAREQAAHA
ncbi:MAG TPA: hypothetical protein VGA30_08345 [Actinomycetota bacterium]